MDIFAALQNNDLVTLLAVSPTAVFDSFSKKVVTVRVMNIVWGDNIIWGENTLLGQTLIGTLSLVGGIR